MPLPYPGKNISDEFIKNPVLYLVPKGTVDHILGGKFVHDDLVVQFVVVGRLLLRQLGISVVLPGLQAVGGAQVGLDDRGKRMDLSTRGAASERQKQQVDGSIGGTVLCRWKRFVLSPS